MSESKTGTWKARDWMVEKDEWMSRVRKTKADAFKECKAATGCSKTEFDLAFKMRPITCKWGGGKREHIENWREARFTPRAWNRRIDILRQNIDALRESSNPVQTAREILNRAMSARATEYVAAECVKFIGIPVQAV